MIGLEVCENILNREFYARAVFPLQILLDFFHIYSIIKVSGLPGIALEGAGLDHAVSSAPLPIQSYTPFCGLTQSGVLFLK